MKSMDVIVVRVYITESSHTLNQILDHLKNQIKIRGITVYRAIRGVGTGGNHEASLLDLSLDLPLVVEFFDEKNKTDSAIDYLNNFIKPEHIIFWQASTNS